MTTRRFRTSARMFCLVLTLAAVGAGARAAPAEHRFNADSPNPKSTRRCQAGEEAFTVLKLTKIEGGVRVDYEFVRSGEASWTNMNRPLLRRFGVRIGATICLPRDPESDEAVDVD